MLTWSSGLRAKYLRDRQQKVILRKLDASSLESDVAPSLYEVPQKLLNIPFMLMAS